MLKKIGIIVPNDNNTVLEDLYLFLKEDFQLIPYKMIETNTKGYPENKKQLTEFINDLRVAGKYFKNSYVNSIVYGRGFGTYTRDGRALIKSVLSDYSKDIILPTEILINKIHGGGANNISLILPYTRDRAENDINMFKEENITIKSGLYLGENEGERIAKISNKELSDKIFENMDNLTSSPYIVLQCTALHTVELIENLKYDIPTKIISSNSVIKNYLMYEINF
jgi:maleate cis-trans isomerase